MPIKYKTDILTLLKEGGYSSYRIRKEKLLGEATLQRLRNNEPVSWENISIICNMLNCKIEDILEYAEEKVNANE